MISRSASVIGPCAWPSASTARPALHRRARRHRIVPALHRRIIVEVDVAAPGEATADWAALRIHGKVMMSAMLYSSPASQCASSRRWSSTRLQPRHLVGVALDRVGDLLLRVGAEVVPLAEHRPDAAHLEHHPFEAFVAADRIFRDQLAAVSSPTGRSGSPPTSNNVKRLAAGAVGIDDRRNAMIRGDLQEFRLELVAGADIDRDHLVFAARALRARCAPCGRSVSARSRLRACQDLRLPRETRVGRY